MFRNYCTGCLTVVYGTAAIVLVVDSIKTYVA